ncbi:MAG: DUF72 domain-containing protein [Phycisphaerae bacterium]
MSARPPARFWIGPSGWSYPDWHGTVYPVRKPRGFKPLAFIARHFNAVEVNSSFYAIPKPRMTASWVPLVPAEFRFAFKLTRTFTHEPDPVPDPAAVAAFAEGLQPVKEAGRLGPLLIQFPWSFRYRAEAVERLRRLAVGFAEFDRVVEVRHASWAQPEALDLLRQIGGYCNIDQPRLRNCLGPTEHVFGPTAYARFHGRNVANWFADNIPTYERYNYLYSEAELREWVARLNALSAKAQSVYVFANNHYRGQGVANALELRAFLEGGPVSVPNDLLRTYPHLKYVARPPREPGLFDLSE